MNSFDASMNQAQAQEWTRCLWTSMTWPDENFKLLDDLTGKNNN